MKVGDWVEVKTASPCKTRGGYVTEVIGDTFKLAGINVPYHKNDLLSQTKPNLKIATKFDANKNRLELLPVTGLEQIGLAMTFGAKKYADNNWAQGFKWSRLSGSALRHIFAWLRGEDTDPESSLSHLAHAGACILMLLSHEKEGLGEDDRRKV